MPAQRGHFCTCIMNVSKQSNISHDKPMLKKFITNFVIDFFHLSG